jgi:glucose/arabinose dehydrogenase
LSGIISAGGERGLLGLAFAPDYGTSRRLFVNYTNPAGHTVVARFLRHAANPLIADPSTRRDLRWGGPTGQPFIEQPFANHNGGNLVFGPEGYLYIGLGDGGGAGDPSHLAQNPNTLLGKMLRIDVNVPDSDPQGYRVPPNNPFIDGVPIAALPEIWAFGLRNPWRFSFDDPARGGTGALIIGDVGQGSWEEIDYEPSGEGGRNYGWRNWEGAHLVNNTQPLAFSPAVMPLFEYSHAVGRSVTGGHVYRGTALPPFATGRYFYADFVAGRVWSAGLSIDPTTGEATLVDQIEHTAELGPVGNVSSFGVDAAGELYIVSYSAGQILRVLPACSFAVSPLTHGFGYLGGSSTLTITTQTDCIATASGGASWLSVSPTTTTGTSTMTLSAPANGFGSFRVATLIVAGQGVTVTQARMPLPRDARGDLDGDARADLTVFRPGNGTWFTLRSSSQLTAASQRTWGISSDMPVARDYDGDGRMDLAVFRPSNGIWYVLESATLFGTAFSARWGVNGDVPVPADYDGDGRADLAVFRPSTGTWFVLESTTHFGTSLARNWGVASDRPAPGDYDGDGRTDLAVFRPSNGNWYVLQSSTGYVSAFSRNWGINGDVPVPADYDGDGRTDIAVFRPSNGTWYVLESWSAWSTVVGKQWGTAGDVPVPADYDGDGRTDFAVFRPSSGTWFVWNQFGVRWGTTGDIVVRSQ